MKGWLIGLSLVLAWLALPGRGLAQEGTPATETVALVFQVLDESGEPQAGVLVQLALLRYAENVTELSSGSCTTDADGRCSLVVSDPPRLADGMAMARVTLVGYGSTTTGWYGDRAEIVLQLGDFAIAATIQANPDISPEEGPYEGQEGTPTDAPAPTGQPSRTPAATRTTSAPTPVDTATSSPLPSATEALAITTTSAPMDTPAALASPTPVSGRADTLLTANLLLICGGLLFLAVGARLFQIAYQRHRETERRRKAEQSREEQSE